MFEAAQRKYRDIRFKKFNAANPANRSIMQKYNIAGFPMLVFLDRKDEVLFNGFAGITKESFEGLIDKFN